MRHRPGPRLREGPIDEWLRTFAELPVLAVFRDADDLERQRLRPVGPGTSGMRIDLPMGSPVGPGPDWPSSRSRLPLGGWWRIRVAKGTTSHDRYPHDLPVPGVDDCLGH